MSAVPPPGPFSLHGKVALVSGAGSVGPGWGNGKATAVLLARRGAAVFATTAYFLERMGLRSLDDLPPPAPHLPDVDELEAELSQRATTATEESP